MKESESSMEKKKRNYILLLIFITVFDFMLVNCENGRYYNTRKRKRKETLHTNTYVQQIL